MSCWSKPILGRRLLNSLWRILTDSMNLWPAMPLNIGWREDFSNDAVGVIWALVSFMSPIALLCNISVCRVIVSNSRRDSIWLWKLKLLRKLSLWNIPPFSKMSLNGSQICKVVKRRAVVFLCVKFLNIERWLLVFYQCSFFQRGWLHSLVIALLISWWD